MTFADFVEKLLDESYSPEEKVQLNKIFMTRDQTLKPRRKDGKSSNRTILSILANEYEQFIFDTMKRKMDEIADSHQANFVTREMNGSYYVSTASHQKHAT